MYKFYKKYNLLLPHTTDEEFRRYDVREREVRSGTKIKTIKEFYLGQNVFIGEKSWNYARSKNHTRFLRCVAIAIWGGRKVIANRCLLPRGQTIVFPDKGPSKLMSAKKVELLLSLLEDYIHDKMPDITESAVLVAAILNLDEPTPLTFSLGLYATRSRVSSRSECVIVVKKTIILKKNVQKQRFFLFKHIYF
uniref:Uncharacterized protein n=1 Tax=Trichogramma kaykai TaxID=54128 RepID=A0ABD2WPN5_9HYME